jgi:hypothetical protein
MFQSETFAPHRRQAGDSIDFHARHGRALQARATRESLDMLFGLLRSVGRRRATQPYWETVWPAAEPSHCARQ